MASNGHHTNFRLPAYMYKDLQVLGKNLKVKEDSKVIRFCIVFTISMISKMGEDIVAESLSNAISDMLFDNKG